MHSSYHQVATLCFLLFLLHVLLHSLFSLHVNLFGFFSILQYVAPLIQAESAQTMFRYNLADADTSQYRSNYEFQPLAFFFFFWQKFQPLATVSYFKHFTSLFWCFPFIYVHKGKKVPSYWNLSASIVLLLRFFFLVSNFPLVISVDYFHLINYTRFGIRFELH